MPPDQQYWETYWKCQPPGCPRPYESEKLHGAQQSLCEQVLCTAAPGIFPRLRQHGAGSAAKTTLLGQPAWAANGTLPLSTGTENGLIYWGVWAL